MALGIGLGLQSASRAFDPSAASFFVRAGITNPTQQSAVNKLVKDLKAAGIWTKMVALYPFVGGTASTHSYNLVNSQFQITWAGGAGVTHNANGITGNGTTGSGDTGCKPSDVGVNGGLSIYMRALPTGDNNATGVDNGVDTSYIINFNVTANQKYGIYGANASLANQSTAVATGFYSINRTSSTALALYRNGASIATDATNSGVAALALNFFLLSRNANGTAAGFTEENDALAAFHQGLTAGESTSFYTAAQTFQTTLGRNV
jgi:hypothetical protein